jgi:hypothetical protein
LPRFISVVIIAATTAVGTQLITTFNAVALRSEEHTTEGVALIERKSAAPTQSLRSTNQALP